MAPISAHDVAKLCLCDEKHFDIQLHQTEHRIKIISGWNINLKGTKILELGCGQGDCTAVLAEMVGPDGHVTAVDPADLSYGAPYTLEQAQSHLSSGRLGDRITWKQADPLTLLESTTETYDIAILSHCLWYFASPEVISKTLQLLAVRAKATCIAEWALSASANEANVHVLAVLTQAALECRKAVSTSNVRTVVSPARIKELAAEADLLLQQETLITPGAGVRDGAWEAGAVISGDFEKEVKENVKDGREQSVVLALRDATVAGVRGVGGTKNVLAMDVWTGVFSASKKFRVVEN